MTKFARVFVLAFLLACHSPVFAQVGAHDHPGTVTEIALYRLFFGLLTTHGAVMAGLLIYIVRRMAKQEAHDKKLKEHSGLIKISLANFTSLDKRFAVFEKQLEHFEEKQNRTIDLLEKLRNEADHE